MSDNGPQIEYDVFVSFRGEDIRHDFLSHLKGEFPRKQINAFLDIKLEKGEEIWPSLVGAIEGSLISVIMFSENYASSRWCLEELAKIHECREKYERKIIPVFYRVNPTDVRHQSGSYKNALAELEKKYDLTQVQKWRDALKKSADLSGIESSKFQDDAELLQEIIKIVDLVLKRSNKHPVNSINSKVLIGIDESVEHLKSLLNHKSKDVRVIGIWGMGGIGKTTIAEEVFNNLCSEYDGSCFLENVREQLGRIGINVLKEKLFSKLLGEDVEINTPNGLSNYIKRRIGRMKVLIVLDDVNSSNQPKILYERPDSFGSGSRIIITTRDMQVLNANEVDDTHKVEKLSSSDALELFKSIAFKHHEMEYCELSKRVVEYAKGIPLVLKILGHLLHGKDKEVWESQLDKLKKMPNHEVHDIMRLSYDDLDSREQEIFLDLACFFGGSNRKIDETETLLKDHENDNSVIVGLERLKDKALITLSKTGDVSMDDIIKEMAWEIDRQRSNKEHGSHNEVLKNDKGTDALRSIRINLSAIRELKLSPHIFVQMSRLKFLVFYSDSYSEDYFHLFPQGLQYLPTELRYLSWRQYPLESLPKQFSAEKLVILDLSFSLVARLWSGVKNLVSLRKVSLRFCRFLQEMPDFTKATNLEVLDISSCYRLTSVHPSIFSLGKLTNLELFCCSSLTKFSSDTHLSSLRYLNLGNCKKLREFSVTSENMTKLDLSLTPMILLPSSFRRQCKLEILVLKYSGLMRLPLCIKNLTTLRELDLCFCREIEIFQELPPSLEILRAADCELLKIVLLPPTAAKQFKENRKRVEFWNCSTLDQRSYKAIELNAQINMIKSARQHLSALENNYAENYVDCSYGYGSFQAMYVYPGSRVPEWLEYKNSTTEDYIIIDLSSAPPSPPLGFIFSFILYKDSWKILDYYKLQFDIILSDDEHGGKVDNIVIQTSVSSENISFDHVCLIYDQQCSHYLSNRVQNLSKFKISATARVIFCTSEHIHWLVLKGFGVSIINTASYHNFTQQMELHDQQNKLKLPSWMREPPKP